MEEKIKNLETSIINTHIEDFKFKLDEVVSMGESPIEKLMILQLFNYFQKFNKKSIDDDTSKFTSIEFIEDELCLFNFPDDDEPLSTYQLKVLAEKAKNFKYRYKKNGLRYKYIGFKCTINKMEHGSNSMVIRDIVIIPQYYQFFNNHHNKIDIAFILKRREWFNDNKIIEERKIAIECDGYDYHSSPSQKREDDIRSRKLKRAGWKDIIRYSGSEIYHINNNLNQMDYNFEELMDIIML